MHSFADKCKRTNKLPIVHLKDDTPPVDGESAPSSCCSFFEPKSWHMKRRMRATRRRFREAVMSGESETTGEVDPTRGRHAGREAERGRKERAGTARKMQVRKVWRAVRRAPSAAGAVASARAHMRPSSFISHPPQVTQTSNKSRADATLRKRSLRSTGGASGLDEGRRGAGVMSRGMRARPARTT